MPRVTITVPEKNAQPYRFQLDRQVVSLGRGSENDIAIDSGSVSVHHAEMRRIKGGYELHDMGSTNGIKLDGLRLLSIPLRNGAVVHIGDVEFDFLLTEEELDTLALEGGVQRTGLMRDTELPSKPPKPVRQTATYTHTASGGSGFGAILIFVIFAVIAFYAGLAIRHQKETGGSLFDAIRANQSARPTPEAPKIPAAE